MPGYFDIIGDTLGGAFGDLYNKAVGIGEDFARQELGLGPDNRGRIADDVATVPPSPTLPSTQGVDALQPYSASSLLSEKNVLIIGAIALGAFIIYKVSK